MGWFKRVRQGLRNAEIASELAQDVQTALQGQKDLGADVAAIREALEILERGSDTMLAEWATTLDKIGRWAARQSARERRDTHKTLDTLASGAPENGQPAAPTALTRPQLRALAARQRGAANVASDEGQ